MWLGHRLVLQASAKSYRAFHERNKFVTGCRLLGTLPWHETRKKINKIHPLPTIKYVWGGQRSHQSISSSLWLAVLGHCESNIVMATMTLTLGRVSQRCARWNVLAWLHVLVEDGKQEWCVTFPLTFVLVVQGTWLMMSNNHTMLCVWAGNDFFVAFLG